MARRAQDVYTEWRGGTCRVNGGAASISPAAASGSSPRADSPTRTVRYNHYGLDKMSEIRHGTGISDDSATLMEDWIDDWFAATDHAYTTYKSYKAIINQHIRPYFTGKTVGEIDVIAYRAFRKHIQKKLPAAGSSRNVMTVLGMILDDAVPRLIKTSPVERKRSAGGT